MIVPSMVKVGLVAGVRHGKGIAVIRDDNGIWRPPTFVSMTGGSVGWQVGIQSTDVVLVFNTRNSVTNLLSGKFTVGVDAAAAAGPMGDRRRRRPMRDCRPRSFRTRAVAACLRAHPWTDRCCRLTRRRTSNTTPRLACVPTGQRPHPTRSIPPSTTRLLATLAAYAPALEQAEAPAATGVPTHPAAGSLPAARRCTGAPPGVPFTAQR